MSFCFNLRAGLPACRYTWHDANPPVISLGRVRFTSALHMGAGHAHKAGVAGRLAWGRLPAHDLLAPKSKPLCTPRPFTLHHLLRVSSYNFPQGSFKLKYSRCVILKTFNCSMGFLEKGNRQGKMMVGDKAALRKDISSIVNYTVCASGAFTMNSKAGIISQLIKTLHS